MKIYKRQYDNPINEDGTDKPNELLGDFEIIETIMEDYYQSEQIGTKDGKTYLITEREVSGYNGGSRFEAKELVNVLQDNSKPKTSPIQYPYMMAGKDIVEFFRKRK